MAADRAADVGLAVAAFADNTLQYLDQHLPLPIGRTVTRSTSLEMQVRIVIITH